MSEQIEQGPGWQMDRTTLRPTITDAEAFRADRQADPYTEVLVALWGGDPTGAEQLLADQPDAFRTRALRADALRDQGRHDEAIAAYRELQASSPAGAQSLLAYHLGIALFDAGRPAEAVHELSQALMLRQSGGSSPATVASTRHALAVATSRTGN
ncbi:tetratricopeptide repeat protein [Luteococcus peritonei]|uniref:Tetratricopeptide repeat protein n=1 Tax=Luteococcus peritonei TaxID=88874 RepID=A0ABW4RRB6_9ACTN